METAEYGELNDAILASRFSRDLMETLNFRSLWLLMSTSFNFGIVLHGTKVHMAYYICN